MNSLDLNEVRTYVNENIVEFHQRRIRSLEGLKLKKLLKKNPYLFRAKNITTAGELITGLLDAFLSSSEEKLFGDFLEGLAIFVASKTCNGHKSTAPGVDLEFENRGVYYIISVKSGPNWGNSSQQGKLADDLQKAAIRVKQSRHRVNVQPVLGICYGKTRTNYLRGYLKVVGQNWFSGNCRGEPMFYTKCGKPSLSLHYMWRWFRVAPRKTTGIPKEPQNFWYLISENEHLYTDIIEPVGH